MGILIVAGIAVPALIAALVHIRDLRRLAWLKARIGTHSAHHHVRLQPTSAAVRTHILRAPPSPAGVAEWQTQPA